MKRRRSDLYKVNSCVELLHSKVHCIYQQPKLKHFYLFLTDVLICYQISADTTVNSSLITV